MVLGGLGRAAERCGIMIIHESRHIADYIRSGLPCPILQDGNSSSPHLVSQVPMYFEVPLSQIDDGTSLSHGLGSEKI